MEVVEEEKSPKVGITVHQLPRPATTVLHQHPAILLNDFLFEADNVEDAQKNFDDMMDLQTSIGERIGEKLGKLENLKLKNFRNLKNIRNPKHLKLNCFFLKLKLEKLTQKWKIEKKKLTIIFKFEKNWKLEKSWTKIFFDRKKN